MLPLPTHLKHSGVKIITMLHVRAALFLMNYILILHIKSCL